MLIMKPTGYTRPDDVILTLQLMAGSLRYRCEWVFCNGCISYPLVWDGCLSLVWMCGGIVAYAGSLELSQPVPVCPTSRFPLVIDSCGTDRLLLLLRGEGSARSQVGPAVTCSVSNSSREMLQASSRSSPGSAFSHQQHDAQQRSGRYSCFKMGVSLKISLLISWTRDKRPSTVRFPLSSVLWLNCQCKWEEACGLFNP